MMLQRIHSSDFWCYSALLGLIALQVISWLYVRHEKKQWMNVPLAPTQAQIESYALGDKQLSYRALSLNVQNFGELAGVSHPFDDYNYIHLRQWLWSLAMVDKQSNYMPFLASYYFSNVKDPEKLRIVINYLADIGRQPEEHKWRWLGQAIALARFDLKDNDLALDLAKELAAMDHHNLPGWAKQMPAFILNNQGDKEGAYEIMLNILKTNADNLPPEEIYFTRDYMCKRLQTPRQASLNPLCTDLKD